MKVLIIEDEKVATEKLVRQINLVKPDIEVVEIIDSVKNAIAWLKENNADLIFLDIQLSDGLCFKIFDEVDIKTPIIFTTAYDHYAIQAFKVNSVDYLLKPINKFELAKSIEKYEQYHKKDNSTEYSSLIELFSDLKRNRYQKRFMVEKGDTIKIILIKDVAYFFAEGKYSFLVQKTGERFLIEFTLEHLNSILDHEEIFRINRQVIVH
jgi:DNA-binding LytR/AlgR family response regulator